MVKLIKIAIKNCDTFSFHSLSTLCNCLATFGVQNEILFKKVKKLLINNYLNTNSVRNNLQFSKDEDEFEKVNKN